jgi:hypothetical protein
MEHFAIAIERIVPDPFPMPLQKDAELSEHLNGQVEVLSKTASNILRLYRSLIAVLGPTTTVRPCSSNRRARYSTLAASTFRKNWKWRRGTWFGGTLGAERKAGLTVADKARKCEI